MKTGSLRYVADGGIYTIQWTQRWRMRAATLSPKKYLHARDPAGHREDDAHAQHQLTCLL